MSMHSSAVSRREVLLILFTVSVTLLCCEYNVLNGLPLSSATASAAKSLGLDTNRTRNANAATTTTAPTTTEAKAAAAEQEEPCLAAMERKFYQRHYDSLQHVPLDDMLVWDAKRDKNNNKARFTGFFKSLDHYTISEQDMDHANDDTLSFLSGPLVGNVNDTRLIHMPGPIPSENQYSLCAAAKVFHAYRQQQQLKSNNSDTDDSSNKPWRHVLLVAMDEDMGGLSSLLQGYTRPFRANKLLVNKWKAHGCSEAFIFEYIDHPDTLAIITTQYHMYNHPKAHSIPLGFAYKNMASSVIETLHEQSPLFNTSITPYKDLCASNNDYNNDIVSNSSSPFHRPTLMMANFNERKIRARAVAALEKNFAGTGITNTYQMSFKGTTVLENKVADYYREAIQSRFLMSPGGAGLGTYRNWESLFAGTIPVVEHLNRTGTDGWYRTFDDLPVAWIDFYQNLTPEWLEQEYIRILQRADTYKWEKLTKHYWIDWINSFLTDVHGKMPR